MNLFSPSSASLSLCGLPFKEQIVSTQWSTARIPVLNQIESGVVVDSLGSRMTKTGPRLFPKNECF